jgi:hypothetical protein
LNLIALSRHQPVPGTFRTGIENFRNAGCGDGPHFSPGDISMRRLSILAAAIGIGLTALAATSPAQASFNLIRWHGTGFCQVWDHSIPTTPFPSDYRTVSAPVPTVVEALAVKEALLRKGTCSF